MKETDVMQEIEQLKQQLAALAQNKTGAENGSPSATNDSGQPTGALEDAGYWFRTILKQAEELIGGLDLQLKDVPAKTALVIFALGVLTGRMLSRRG